MKRALLALAVASAVICGCGNQNNPPKEPTGPRPDEENVWHPGGKHTAHNEPLHDTQGGQEVP